MSYVANLQYFHSVLSELTGFPIVLLTFPSWEFQSQSKILKSAFLSRRYSKCLYLSKTTDAPLNDHGFLPIFTRITPYTTIGYQFWIASIFYSFKSLCLKLCMYCRRGLLVSIIVGKLFEIGRRLLRYPSRTYWKRDDLVPHRRCHFESIRHNLIKKAWYLYKIFLQSAILDIHSI